MEVRVNCPDHIHLRPGSPARHADRKRKLWINPAKNVAHCWRCGWGTRDAQEAVTRYRIVLPAGVRFQTTLGELLLDDKGQVIPAVTLPLYFSQDFDSSIGLRYWHYLAARRLDRETVFGYGIGYCPAGDYANRIVLPVYQHGELQTWQARDITDQQPAKYMGPPGVKAEAMFNLARAATTRVIVLTEGIFDALAIPMYGVATLGTRGGLLTPGRLKQLYDADPHAIIIGFDRGAEVERDKLVRQLWGLFPVVEAWTPQRAKDLGECSPSEKSGLLVRCAELVVAGQD